MCKLKERDRKLSLLSHWLWSRSHGLSIGQTLPSCSCLKIKATITTIFWAWTPTLKQGTETCTMRFMLFLFIVRVRYCIEQTCLWLGFICPKDECSDKKHNFFCAAKGRPVAAQYILQTRTKKGQTERRLKRFVFIGLLSSCPPGVSHKV